MGIRLRKSFGKLVRLNVSLKGVSVSAGPRGFGSVNVPLLGRKRPPQLNVNLPGPFYYSTPLVSSAARHHPLEPVYRQPVVIEATATTTLTAEERTAIAKRPITFAVAYVRGFFSGLFAALCGR